MTTRSISALCSFAFALISANGRLNAANITYTEVDVLHQLNFQTPYFNGASWYNTLTFTVAPGSSGSQDFHFDLYPDNEGLTFFGTGDVSVDQTSAPPKTGSVTLHVTATGAGTFGIHELAPPFYSADGFDLSSTDPLQIYTSTITGRKVLFFQGPAGANLNAPAGITWRTTVDIPGDWSLATTGNDYGGHLFGYYNPLWTVTSDFVYNSATNQTVLSLVNSNYPGAGATFPDDGPYPTFYLAGQVAPEPAQMSSLGLLILGGLLVWRRRSPSTSE